MDISHPVAVLPLPDNIRRRFTEPPTLWFVGNGQLLNANLLGLLCSRECPGSAILETLDKVPEWIESGRVVVSGFHSPLEQQILRSLLRRSGKAVKVLARSLENHHLLPVEHQAIADGHLLLISPFASNVHRTTRATALERNRLVIALAAERVVPYVKEQSPLAELLREGEENHFDPQRNAIPRLKK